MVSFAAEAMIGAVLTPDTGETNEFTFHLGIFVGALDTKTAQVLTTSFVDLIFDPQANQLTLQGLELALSDMEAKAVKTSSIREKKPLSPPGSPNRDWMRSYSS